MTVQLPIARRTAFFLLNVLDDCDMSDCQAIEAGLLSPPPSQTTSIANQECDLPLGSENLNPSLSLVPIALVAWWALCAPSFLRRLNLEQDVGQ